MAPEDEWVLDRQNERRRPFQVGRIEYGAWGEGRSLQFG